MLTLQIITYSFRIINFEFMKCNSKILPDYSIEDNNHLVYMYLFLKPFSLVILRFVTIKDNVNRENRAHSHHIHYIKDHFIPTLSNY